MRLRAALRPWDAARCAIAAVFLTDGLGFGVWVTQLPLLKGGLGLSDLDFAVALAGLVIGAFVAMPIAGVLATRFGSRRLTRLAVIGGALGLVLPGWAPGLPSLVTATAALGLMRGMTEVPMNAQATLLEKRHGRARMSSFHGCFSLGGFLGACLGSVLLRAGLPAAATLTGVGAGLGLTALLATRRLLHDVPGRDAPIENTSGSDVPVSNAPLIDAPGRGAPVPDAPPRDAPSRDAPNRNVLSRKAPGQDRQAAPPRPSLPALLRDTALLATGLLAFFGLFGEGAMADWSALLLQRTTGAAPSAAALGYAAFSVAMMAGRFSGDLAVARLGPVRALRLSGAAAALGMVAALVSPYWLAVLGFAVAGLGYANLVPILFSAGGRGAGSAGIAAVSTLGYAGFVVGPPCIGTLSSLTGSLPLALAPVALFGAAIALGARAVAQATPPPTSAQE